MTLRIVTDSTCDLPEATIQKHGITVLPLFINIGDQSYQDNIDISREAFYRGLPEYDSHPTTATPGTEQFVGIFQDLIDQGATEILSIHISESLSATVNVARLAAKEIQSIPVTVWDSKQLSLGTGFLVLRAAEAAAQGSNAESIVKVLEEQTQRTHVVAALDTLEFLRRSGRMNGVVAGIGSLLQVKPLLKMHNGVPSSERVRTTNGATARLKELLIEQSPLEKVAIVHANAQDKADAFLKEIASVLPPGDIPCVDITPVIGAHIGPGAVGFACVSASD